MRILISGGGTGGHIFPALAIAEAIRQLQPSAEILFVGARGKMEMQLVPKYGFPIRGLWIRGWRRQSIRSNVLFPVRLAVSLYQAWRIVRAFHPHVAIGTGGYAAGPALEIASRYGVPIVLQEQNSYPGWTNRLLAKKAHAICVAYPQMERYFPRHKIHFTGNPVRREIIHCHYTSEEARQRLGLDPQRRTIVIFGGSLGAKTLNEAVARNYKLIKDHEEDLQILWQVGRGYWDAYKHCDVAALPSVMAVPFVDDMAAAYRAATLVISRAGAIAISEIAATQSAALFVPSPNVAENHQYKNAETLVQHNAAAMIDDRSAVEKLLPVALAYLQREDLLTAWKNNIAAFYRPNAAHRIAEIAMRLYQ